MYLLEKLLYFRYCIFTKRVPFEILLADNPKTLRLTSEKWELLENPAANAASVMGIPEKILLYTHISLW